MRYLPYELLKEGMTVGIALYGSNFNVLIGEDMTLGAHTIRRIGELGYAGIYIKDDISSDVNVAEVISPSLRVRTVQNAKEISQNVKRGVFRRQKVTREYQNKIIMPVIGSIISSPKRIYDVIDLKTFNDYDFYHAANVLVLSLLIGVEMGLSGKELQEMGMSALLHDIGNLFIPQNLLKKPGKLTDEEYETIKTHSLRGFEYLRNHFDMTIEACMGAFQHHENYDGTGYPNRLKGKVITIYGRIIAVATVYDSLISDRPFRAAAYPPAAMDFMESYSGTMFDPDVLKALKNVTPLYPAGCIVELEDGQECIVIENHEGAPTRPVLKRLERDGADEEPVYMNLNSDAKYAGVHISEIIEM